MAQLFALFDWIPNKAKRPPALSPSIYFQALPLSCLQLRCARTFANTDPNTGQCPINAVPAFPIFAISVSSRRLSSLPYAVTSGQSAACFLV